MNDYTDGHGDPDARTASDLVFCNRPGEGTVSLDCPQCCAGQINDSESGVVQMPGRWVENDRRGGDAWVLECVGCGTQYSRREFFDPEDVPMAVLENGVFVNASMAARKVYQWGPDEHENAASAAAGEEGVEASPAGRG